ncbi:hypothetical protein B0T24DRAFT_73807 [Lasiosphaeria ovina]|uniref:Uncharacterized protein n=1 Tax=Lasiosphaeria ovina TaxID=92902 RepID=A0AAE0NMD4_9PEZI|nr:hypothetical protein B0T24DRAFT_73807 [Lasiosphaeria ovina]
MAPADHRQVGGELATTSFNDSGSLCGRLATIGASVSPNIVTIGGIVKQGDQYWAITANHKARQVSSRPDTIPRNGNVLSQLDTDFSPRDYDMKDLQPVWIIERPRDGTRAAVRENRTPGPIIRLEAAREDRSGQSKTEWALMPIKDPEHYLPNQFMTVPGDPTTYRSLDRIAQKARAGRVIVLGGVSGQHAMTMLPSEAGLCMPSGDLITTWRLKPLDNEMKIQDGDSGSWIVDPEDGSVFGLVVATLAGRVHLIPLKDILADKGGLTLPDQDDIDVARAVLALNISTQKGIKLVARSRKTADVLEELVEEGEQVATDIVARRDDLKRLKQAKMRSKDGESSPNTKKTEEIARQGGVHTNSKRSEAAVARAADRKKLRDAAKKDGRQTASATKSVSSGVVPQRPKEDSAASESHGPKHQSVRGGFDGSCSRARTYKGKGRNWANILQIVVRGLLFAERSLRPLSRTSREHLN